MRKLRKPLPLQERYIAYPAAPLIESAPFCPQCGTAQPRVINCSKCGSPFIIPVHLIDKKSREASLFCQSCGGQLEFKGIETDGE